MTYTERLQRLIRILEDAKKQDVIAFRISDWLTYTDKPCVTAACAGGFACLDKELQAEGLDLDSREPKFKNEVGYGALAEFFGLSRTAVYKIFNPLYYHVGPVTIDNVLERIREVI